MIYQKKIIFRHTLLDIPIALFLLSLTFSTMVSVDVRTSLLGYYGRFHGGLTSYISYSILYWAFVTYFDKKNTGNIIRTLLISTTIAAVYAALEHFGKSISCLFVDGTFSVNCWVQDVAFRVFGTFGQPNWLAAWLVAIIPLTFVVKNPTKTAQSIMLWLSTLFFTTLLFTKSRSGLLAFAISYILYLSFTLSKKRVTALRPFLVVSCILFAIASIVGTPWTSSILDKFNKPTEVTTQTTTGTVLEAGGTESGDIRQIVWQGALNLWKKYPLFGTGTDTFALAYYETRPIEHNNVSEWNFLYNRAHNEYLNFMATTGTFGIVSYLILIGTSLYMLLDNKPLLAGYTSILITNFFGFSVTPIALLFFLFPALAIASQNKINELQHKPLTTGQKLTTLAILLIAGYLLLSIGKYWLADLKYTKGVDLNKSERYTEASEALKSAITLSPNEALYHDELASSFGELAIASFIAKDTVNTNKYISLSIDEINKTTELAPHDIKLLKTKTATLANLGAMNPDYYEEAIKHLKTLTALAPTEPTAHFRLALNNARLGRNEEALEWLLEAIELKPNYENARLFLGLLYEDLGNKEKASEQYRYILENITRNNKVAEENLDAINNSQ